MLSDAQLALLADLLADRLAPLLTQPAVSEAALVSAAQLARVLGCSREWVYAHAAELGARGLGNGPKPRLRFEVERAREAMARLGSEQSQASDRSARAKSVTPNARAPRRSPSRSPKVGSILAVRDREPVGGKR